jgi:gluconolactonase
VGNWVWRFDPATNSTTPVADGFLKPDGVVFSPDFKTVYVSDTGAVDGEPGNDASSERAAPGLYAFDVALDAGGLPTLRNRRLFGVCASGVPDGLKVDEHGNLYACVPAGVDVFSPTGQALGSIAVGHVGNLAFAGRQLLMLQEERVSALPMRVKGVRLPMQGKV